MKIITLFVCLLISLSVQAQKLTIYTYDSFVSEWGPGPIIKEKFEKNYNTELEFVAVDSAATLLNKIILEGSTTKADIILGLDMNLLDAANKSNLFSNIILRILMIKYNYQLNGTLKILYLIIMDILRLYTIIKF